MLSPTLQYMHQSQCVDKYTFQGSNIHMQYIMNFGKYVVSELFVTLVNTEKDLVNKIPITNNIL